MCNCNKPRRPVGDSSAKAAAVTKSQAQQVREAQAAKRSTSTAKAASRYSLTTDGRTMTFGSRLEAEAANARAGRTGTVRPA